MIPEKQTFEIKDGWLCVKYQSTYTDRPVVAVRFWPIAPRVDFSQERLDMIVGKEAIDNKQNGSYSARLAPFEYLDFRLKDGGKTVPMAAEEYPAEKPKARTEVRWYFGRWQKYLKSSGWVDLGVVFK